MKGAVWLQEIPKQVLKCKAINEKPPAHLLTLWIFFSLSLCFPHEGQTSKVSIFLDVCCCFRLHLNGIGWSPPLPARNMRSKFTAALFEVCCRYVWRERHWLVVVYRPEHPSPTVASHKHTVYTNSPQPNQLCLARGRKDEVIFPQWNQTHGTGCNNMVTDSWATCGQRQPQQPSPSAVTESEAWDSQASCLHRQTLLHCGHWIIRIHIHNVYVYIYT